MSGEYRCGEGRPIGNILKEGSGSIGVLGEVCQVRDKGISSSNFYGRDCDGITTPK